jgi:hypothetical protein
LGTAARYVTHGLGTQKILRPSPLLIASHGDKAQVRKELFNEVEVQLLEVRGKIDTPGWGSSSII